MVCPKASENYLNYHTGRTDQFSIAKLKCVRIETETFLKANDKIRMPEKHDTFTSISIMFVSLYLVQNVKVIEKQ